ncbi:hypothetical protein AMS68_006033 [Peltaster fructicola]|uniref:RING-type domain-containing protein n=1 Tax=Peltaster fructicola TaxID=286661 RepID=A0A6H0Y0Q9_9PEZI|nr:hypothetical protein AMS68_006033 [Peltaster fructicola]
MSHSKRNSTRAFFTPHERAELKGRWGTNSTRLTRDSFLPFGSCNLCLLQARDPVSCSTGGHLFCRECALSNLLAQNKDIKRLKKEATRKKAEEDDERQLADAEAQAKALASFERTQAGEDVPSGQKRKRQDEAGEDRESKRKGEDSSFWIPSQTQGAKHENTKTLKQTPLCPVNTKPHDFSLKGLVTVKFNEPQSTDDQNKSRICPSCDKTLSNSTKAMLAIPCGHVMCKSCSDKFQKPPDKSAHDQDTDEPARCYVCQGDLTPSTEKSESKIGRGLIELRSDGTGFAGGGENMVKREGLAFQFG